MRNKILVFIVAALICVLGSTISCGDQDNSRTLTTYPIVTPTPPPATDTDGDTVPDLQDCNPNSILYWALLLFYPDADGDNIPDSGAGVRICVGDPSTYPDNYTTTAPPPLDRCLGDPTNSCSTARPYLRIAASFSALPYGWWLGGTCFVDPDPPDVFPEMGSGQGQNINLVGDVNPEAVNGGSCIFAINFQPPIINACGTSTDWFPCQNGQGLLFSGLNGNGLADIQIYLSPSGIATDEIVLAWSVIDNNQGGGNFLVNLGTGGDGDVNIIASLPIDTDGDGILNPNDNCIWVENPGQEANPGNLIGANGLRVGNACLGIDTDNDGYLDGPDACPFDPTCH